MGHKKIVYLALGTLLQASLVGCSTFGKPKPPSVGGPVNTPTWTERITGVFTPSAKPKAVAQNSQSDFPNGKKLKPDAELYVGLAEVAERSGRADEAKKQYELALKQDPNYLPALLGMARFYDRQGQMEVATTWYQKALTKHPKNGQVYNDLGLCYHRRHMMNEAVGSFNQAIRLDPEKKLYRNNLAQALIDINKPDDALAQLRIGYGEAVAQYNVGCLLAKRGENQRALPYFQRALAADANMTAAQEWIARLDNSGGHPTGPTQSMLQGSAASATIPASAALPTVERLPASEYRAPVIKSSTARESHVAAPSGNLPTVEYGESENPLRRTSRPASAVNQELPATATAPAIPATPTAATEPAVEQVVNPHASAAPTAPTSAPVEMPRTTRPLQYPVTTERQAPAEEIPPLPGRYDVD